MAKNIVIFVLVIAVALLGWWAYMHGIVPADMLHNGTATTTKPTPAICAQVITPARDPKTGTIKEFPTPCDVPTGWVVIQNDVPSLDDLH